MLVHSKYTRAAVSLGKRCLDVITAWNRGYLPGKPARQPEPGRSFKAGSLESLSLGEEKSSPMVEEKTPGWDKQQDHMHEMEDSLSLWQAE